MRQFHHMLHIAVAHLHHRAELFVEQRAQRVAVRLVEIDRQADVAGERHLAQRDEQAAVGTVVIGEQLALVIQPLDQPEERFEHQRIVDIRRDVADLLVHLRQRRAAQAVLALPQVDQQQRGIQERRELRRQRLARIRARRECGDDQRQRRGHGFVFARLPAMPSSSTSNPCRPGC